MSRYAIGDRLKAKLDKAISEATTESYKMLNRDDYLVDIGYFNNPNLFPRVDEYAREAFPHTSTGAKNASNAARYVRWAAMRLLIPVQRDDEYVNDQSVVDRCNQLSEEIHLTAIWMLKRAGY